MSFIHDEHPRIFASVKYFPLTQDKPELPRPSALEALRTQMLRGKGVERSDLLFEGTFYNAESEELARFMFNYAVARNTGWEPIRFSDFARTYHTTIVLWNAGRMNPTGGREHVVADTPPLLQYRRAFESNPIMKFLRGDCYFLYFTEESVERMEHSLRAALK